MSEKIQSKYLCLSTFLSPDAFAFRPFNIDIFNYLKILTNSNSDSEKICSICLKNCKRLSRPESCMHNFCYSCLKKWKKYKAICPYCRKPFKKIIYNYKG